MVFDLLLAALLLALFMYVVSRREAWRQPRVVLLLAALAVAGLVLGAVIALVLGAVASASASALYVLAGAVVVFEAYRWRRRRSGRT